MNMKNYRNAGVPLVAFECADPAAVLADVVKGVKNGDTPPVVVWDCVRGIIPGNSEGQDLAGALNQGNEPAIATGNPVEALRALQAIPTLAPGAVVVMFGLAPLMQDSQSGPVIRQALWNLRDTFKGVGACVVLTVPLGYKFSPDLAGDFVTEVVGLPDEKRISSVVVETLGAANLVNEKPETIEKAVSALLGLPEFSAEQALALSLSKDGVNQSDLWERKRRAIEQTPGLQVWRGGETFADVGGCDNVKGFFQRLIKGKRAPRVVVFIDEIEKAFAGVGTDTSGVSTGMLGAMLSFMQDENVTGSIFIGPPGAAKSAVGKALGAEAGCPTVSWDMGAMKDSLVGSSEARIRAGLATVKAVGAGRILFVATCNSIGVLPPELRRRFTLGTFFFDLPTAEERALIWAIWRKKYGIQDTSLPADDGWTGAEIRQCCDIADRLACSLLQAAEFVIPVARSAADKIEELRKQANGKFLSAAAPGVYRYDTTAKAGRKVSL